MTEQISVDVRLGVTIITLPTGHREIVPHDDPRVLTITIDQPPTPVSDHPEAEVADRPWMPLEPAVPMKDGKRIEIPGTEVWKNDLYTVHKTYAQWQGTTTDPVPPPVLIHLSIRRNDRHWARDWRHFQRIKNELVGPEHEGVELYPAESRLVDTSNQFHIWVLGDPGARWPAGWEDGRVVFNDDLVSIGSRQRPHPEDVLETVTEEDAKRMVLAYLDSRGMDVPPELREETT